jgi:hypothetical protein
VEREEEVPPSAAPQKKAPVSREEMKKRFEQMSPEERAAARERFRGMRDGGGAEEGSRKDP